MRLFPRLMLIALVLLAIGLTLFTQYGAEARGKKPVDFTLKNTAGDDVKLSSFRGKVVIVDVWATWCGYCVREIPDIIKFQEEVTEKKMPVQVLGLSIDRNKQDAKDFEKERKLNYPVVFTEQKNIEKLGEVVGVPTKFLIDKKGVVVDSFTGPMSKEMMMKWVAKYAK